jgi:hypothetical protein
MSWADDIRCLYCDGRLPLYRKITNGQFCSAAHRKAYWQEQERLAVERLHQTHDSLRAYKPHGPVEAILGKTEDPIEASAERPAWLTQANTGEVAIAPFVRDLVRIQEHLLAGPAAALAELLPSTIAPRLAVSALRLREVRPRASARVAIPFFSPFTMDVKLRAPSVAAAPSLIIPVRRIAWDAVVIPDAVEIVIAPAPLQERLFAIAHPIIAQAICQAILDESEDFEIFGEAMLPSGSYALRIPEFAPFGEQLFAIAHPKIAQAIYQAIRPETEPFEILSGAMLPAGSYAATVPGFVPGERLQKLSLEEVAPAVAPHTQTTDAIDLRSSAETPVWNLTTPPLRPRLRLASGRRYQVETPTVLAPAGITLANLEIPASDISMPRRNAQVMRAAGAPASAAPSVVAQKPAFEPGPAGLLPLSQAAPTASPAIRPAPAVFSGPQPPRTEPVRPVARFEPHRDFMAHPPVAAPLVADDEDAPKHFNLWAPAIDFWNRAPRDLKMLAFAIPVLLGLALHPALPKVRVAAPTVASGFPKNVQNAMNTQWANVKQQVFDRAAIALDEDFRSGLDDWASRGDTATEWSFDSTGFVRPGALALYRPSMNLIDYQVQFLGMIDRKALSWVVRAEDFDNYYVVKLMVLKPGPLPTIGVTRYAVVNGIPDSRSDVIVPIDARNDMLYRVRMDVRGEDFSLTVQGQMVDAWSEPRLMRGGIGFFTARGEESRLRWVQVTHQYDMLGRLCAYLAPYNIPTTGNTGP